MKPADSLRMSVSTALVVVTRAMKQEADAALASFNLSHSAAWPLVMIGRLGEGTRQGAVAEAVGIEGPSLVRLIDQLCAAGLVERKDDANDRRAKALYLTKEGRLLRDEIEASLIQWRKRLFHGVSADDLEACMRVFGSIASSLGRPDLLGQLNRK